MRTLDRLSIYALSFAIVALVIALLMQKSRKSGDTGEIAPLPDSPSQEWVSKLNRTLAQQEQEMDTRRFDKKLNRIGVHNE